jgi:hypothetical protein
VEFRSQRPAIFCAMCITSLRLALTEIVTQTGWTKGRAFYGQKVSAGSPKTSSVNLNMQSRISAAIL